MKAAQDRAITSNLTNVHFVIGDMTSLPFKSGTFDYVFCPRFSINAVATIEKRRRAVAEMLRVVKPEGTVFIESFNKYYWGRGPVLPITNFIRDIGRSANMFSCRIFRRSYEGLLPGDIIYSANKVVGASEGYAHLPTIWEIRRWIPYGRRFKLFSIPQITGKVRWDVLKYVRYSIWVVLGCK